MSPVALIDDMGVDNVGFLIENLGADAAPMQYLRELVQNELESIQRAGIPDGQVEIDYVEVKGVRKLRIAGNGGGMTPDEVASNINRLSASGAVQAFDKNFGIGAKITAGTRNPHGVVYESWKDGFGSTTILGRLDRRYGRLGFRNDDDTVDYWLPLPQEQRHPIIKDHGVSVVLLGQNDHEDTTVPPPGADLPSQWVSAYLERRYFALPDGISLRVLRPVPIFDSQKDSWREIYDTIRGQKHYLDLHSDAHGSVELPDAAAIVRWWLLSDEIISGGKTWNNRGHVAALYQDELYEVRSGPSRTSALKDFGIYAGFGRIVIYVEPTQVLKANTSRTALILKGSQPIDYGAIGASFVDKMPPELEAFMAGQVTAEHGDHRKAINKSLKEVDEALNRARFRRSRSGRVDFYDPEVGGLGGEGAQERTGAEEGPDRRRSRDAGGRIGGEYLRLAREERDRRMRGEKVEDDPSPKIVWDHEGTATQIGRAATYNPRVNTVTANPKYSFYLDMVEWAMEEAKQRSASEMDEQALRGIVEDEVKRWFEQALAETVVVLRPMAHDAKWGPMVYETALSDEGLTAAIISHRWHMMSTIKRGLAGRLGKHRDSAA